jgi:hypothetical protein
MALIDLGSIRIVNNNGEKISLIIDAEPFLSTQYDQVEGHGETFAEALQSLYLEVEGMTE